VIDIAIVNPQIDEINFSITEGKDKIGIVAIYVTAIEVAGEG